MLEMHSYYLDRNVRQKLAWKIRDKLPTILSVDETYDRLHIAQKVSVFRSSFQGGILIWYQ